MIDMFMKGFIMILVSLTSLNLLGQSANWRKQNFNLSKNSVAISGYDPVSYFNGKPKVGNPNNFYEYEGILYYFSSDSNKSQFVLEPSKYEPQFGGWCAYAIGDSGDKVGIDPETFKIINGKLYLFYNKFFTNTLDMWNDDEAKLKVQSKINWNKLMNE